MGSVAEARQTEQQVGPGQGIQRTMRLLASSTPKKRNHVRILFYGQSITEQNWSKQVADDLRKRFPNADLEIENRAIGGFASQWLWRTAEYDLYPFNPDLMIFHVYGSHIDYEKIIRNARERTTAEILMQTDHVTAWPPANPSEKDDEGLWWTELMNHTYLPDIAKKYGCALVDVRSGWLQHLRDNKLEPKALLKDGVHLNDAGCDVMAKLVSDYLVYRPELKEQNKGVSDLSLKNLKWVNNEAKVAFTGTGIDLLPDTKGFTGSLSFLIDGKLVSAFPEAYAFTRPDPAPWSPLFIRRIDHPTPLVAEEWTLTVNEVSNEGKTFRYTVKGSATGPDGEDSSEGRFRSNSGRLLIDPADFFRNGELKAGYTVRWRAYLMGTDQLNSIAPFDPALENPIRIVHGLESGPHTLTIRRSGLISLKGLRIFNPKQ